MAGASNEALKGIYTEILRTTDAFDALKQNDRSLIQLCLDLNPKDPQLLKNVSSAVAACTFAQKAPLYRIGTLMWFCLKVQPALASKFPMFLKTMYDESHLGEEAIREWHTAPYDAIVAAIPSSYGDHGEAVPIESNSVSVAEVSKLKSSCDIFINWLNEQDEEEDDEDEDDDDEEEEA